MSALFQPSRSAPLLFFGGPYSNLEALLALLERARALGIPDRNLLCTGDLVAYCADPQAVVDVVRARNIAVVQGNCEESLGADSADCGCGFDPGSTCEALSAEWYRYASANLDAHSKAWMRQLPAQIAFRWGAQRWLAVHGSRRQNNRFLFASASDAQLAAELPLDANIVVAGHCGIPFTRRVRAQLWHNAGVIGMPANDGTPRGWFSVAERRGDGIVINSLPLSYDAAAASRKMRARGLRGYAQALLSGLWPSTDVLPPRERQASGTALAFAPVHWPASVRHAHTRTPARNVFNAEWESI